MNVPYTFHAKKGIAYRRIQDEMVLVDPSKNILLRLNETASYIWERLESMSTQAIAQAIEDEFDVSQSAAKKDVDKFIALLLEKNLIVSRETTK